MAFILRSDSSSVWFGFGHIDFKLLTYIKYNVIINRDRIFISAILSFYFFTYCEQSRRVTAIHMCSFCAHATVITSCHSQLPCSYQPMAFQGLDFSFIIHISNFVFQLLCVLWAKSTRYRLKGSFCMQGTVVTSG